MVAAQGRKPNAPFPYFGGKSRIAADVWSRFGAVDHYMEPFFGSGAVLLARPGPPFGREIVNDLDSLIVNFWRAVKYNPTAAADFADWPTSEVDRHARHDYIRRELPDLTEKCLADPMYFDAKIAGWWVWGKAMEIGGSWCSWDGPWRVVDGRFIKAGNGGISRQMSAISSNRGVRRSSADIRSWFTELQERLSRVSVVCGAWDRILTAKLGDGITGVFLDPPYSGEYSQRYSVGGDCAADVFEWCRVNGSNPQLRIALCGHDLTAPGAGWTLLRWKGSKGYAKNANRHRETIWFSPACLDPTLALWADEQDDEEQVIA